MKRIITIIAVTMAALFIFAPHAEAQKSRRSSSSSHSRSHHSSGSSHSRPTRSTVKVRSYRTKKGTTVATHRRTSADKSFGNNWSTKGNTNPITGKKGTKTHPSRKH